MSCRIYFIFSLFWRIGLYFLITKIDHMWTNMTEWTNSSKTINWIFLIWKTLYMCMIQMILFTVEDAFWISFKFIHTIAEHWTVLVLHRLFIHKSWPTLLFVFHGIAVSQALGVASAQAHHQKIQQYILTSRPKEAVRSNPVHTFYWNVGLICSKDNSWIQIFIISDNVPLQ